MTQAEKFQQWCQENDGKVDIIQPDDGSGYTVMEVTLQHLWGGTTFSVTVNEG